MDVYMSRGVVINEFDPPAEPVELSGVHAVHLFSAIS